MNLVYAIWLTASALLSAVVALIAWRRRSATGAVGLALYMLIMVVWAGAYAVRWMFSNLEAQYFWLNMTYLGVVAVPFCTTIFVLQYTHRSRFLTRRNLLLLAVVPLLTLVIMWTDNLHGWFYDGLRNPDRIIVGGPWFWINAYYSYAVYFVMLALILLEYLNASHVYRGQTLTILVGMILPAAGSLVSMSGRSPFTDLDITPIVFIFSGIVLSYGLFRYQLLDLVPVAQSTLIESLPEGVLVLDGHLRILEINPAAQEMLACKARAIGGSAETALGLWPMLKKIYETRASGWMEMTISEKPLREIEVQVKPLLDRIENLSGSLFILRDITERKQLEGKLKQMSIHDGLTGLFNRSFFEEELMRLEAGRHYPVSLLMADVFDLKSVNDLKGHAAGDEMLKRAAHVLSEAFRAEDVITRIGGDEFMVILPNTDAKAARSALERVLQGLRDHNSVHPDDPLQVSFGVSTVEAGTPLTEAYRLADEDMYREKRTQRKSNGTRN